jgi:hypothetical protein
VEKPLGQELEEEHGEHHGSQDEHKLDELSLRVHVVFRISKTAAA